MEGAENRPFILAVEMKFKTTEDRDEFISIWAPLGKWVEENEPHTLCFELCVADTDPLKIMVYERFSTKAAFDDIHRTSEPYLQFKAQQGEWRTAHGVEVTGQSYYPSGAGYFKQSS